MDMPPENQDTHCLLNVGRFPSAFLNSKSESVKGKVHHKKRRINLLFRSCVLTQAYVVLVGKRSKLKIIMRKNKTTQAPAEEISKLLRNSNNPANIEMV